MVGPLIFEMPAKLSRQCSSAPAHKFFTKVEQSCSNARFLKKAKCSNACFLTKFESLYASQYSSQHILICHARRPTTLSTLVSCIKRHYV